MYQSPFEFYNPVQLPYFFQYSQGGFNQARIAAPYQTAAPQLWGYIPFNNQFPVAGNIFYPYIPANGGFISPNKPLSPQIPLPLLSLPMPQTSLEYPIPNDIPQARQTALKDAIEWILENPTPLANNTAVEVGEEIMLFYQLYRRAGAQEAKDYCKEYIAVRIQEIVNSGKFNNPTQGELTVFVPISQIMSALGLSLFDYRSFILEKVLSNPETYSPTHKMWNTSILERLGFHPSIPLVQLVSQGSIAKEYETGQLMYLMDAPNADELLIMGRFYDIAHEIIPLSNFGETPITLLSDQKMAFLKTLIHRGIRFFIDHPDFDILSELLICANMIELDDQLLLEQAYNYILSQQMEDGSFGTNPRLTEMGRSNPARHLVFVAVWALIQ